MAYYRLQLLFLSICLYVRFMSVCHLVCLIDNMNNESEVTQVFELLKDSTQYQIAQISYPIVKMENLRKIRQDVIRK